MNAWLFDDLAPLVDAAGFKSRNCHPNPASVGLALMAPVPHAAPAGTSSVAAGRVKGQANQQRAAVLAFIVQAGKHGAIDAEVEVGTGIAAQTASLRRGELVKFGLIVDSGRRRPTPRGTLAAVWITATLAMVKPQTAGAPTGREGGRQ